MTEKTIEQLQEDVEHAKFALARAEAAAAFKEFPKHVEPHESHVVKQEVPGLPPHVSVPMFGEHHVDRAGKITVLVHSVEEEARALAAAVAKEA